MAHRTVPVIRLAEEHPPDCHTTTDLPQCPHCGFLLHAARLESRSFNDCAACGRDFYFEVVQVPGTLYLTSKDGPVFHATSAAMAEDLADCFGASAGR